MGKIFDNPSDWASGCREDRAALRWGFPAPNEGTPTCPSVEPEARGSIGFLIDVGTTVCFGLGISRDGTGRTCYGPPPEVYMGWTSIPFKVG